MKKHDTSVTKVSAETSPHGEMGQRYLASGTHVAMRLWEEEAPQETPLTEREYETVGFVISGRAEIELEGQSLRLDPGDSWVVPSGAAHRYRIMESFTAVEATTPPAHAKGRDAPQ